MVNSICSAAFCESAALRKKCFAEFQRAKPSQSRLTACQIPPPFWAKGCFLSNPHAIIDERCYFLYTKLINAGTIFLLCQGLLRRI